MPQACRPRVERLACASSCSVVRWMRRGRSPSPEHGPSSSTASKLSAGKPLQQHQARCRQALDMSGVQCT